MRRCGSLARIGTPLGERAPVSEPSCARSSAAPASRCAGADRWRGSHAARRARAGQHPVVAPLGGDRPRRDLPRLQPRRRHQRAVRLDDLQRRQAPGHERIAVAGAHCVEDLLGDDADVEPLRHHQVVPRIGGETPIRLRRSVAGDVEGELHLVDGVPPHARHSEGGPAQHGSFRRPRERLDAGEPELHRQVAAVLLDVGVHAVGVRGEQPPGVGVIARPLRLVPRPA